MKSESLVFNAGFPMTTAIRLAHNLSELRSHAEYIAFIEEEEEYPDEILIEAGEDTLELLQELVKDIAELKLEEEIKKAKQRQSGPTGVVKEMKEMEEGDDGSPANEKEQPSAVAEPVVTEERKDPK